MTSSAAASILVVDDTIENLHLLSNLLTALGYEVRPVTSGRQALQAAESAPPELILLDVSMPEMNGYEVCHRLKQSERLRDVPVIFLTALTDTADKVRGFEAGGADYITKPFQVDEVLARVKAHVDLRLSHLELERSYDRLRSLERLREDLVQMVVHDMRSPLTALTILLDHVLSSAGPALAGEVGEDLRIALQSAARVNRMANDLLDVSRLEEGKLPLERQPHDLIPICRDVASRLAAVDRDRAIDVVGGAPAVVCDRGIIARVVENLVGNALKHTPGAGRIRVAVSVGSDRARVAVHDRGPGVAPELRRSIFDKFGAVATRRDGTFHSAGLGLAFCKLAIEAHGGAIGVDGAGPTGSVFWFELPA